MYPKCFCSRGSARNPAGGAHSASSDSHIWIWGSTSRQGKEGNRKEEEGEVDKGRGERKGK